MRTGQTDGGAGARLAANGSGLVMSHKPGRRQDAAAGPVHGGPAAVRRPHEHRTGGQTVADISNTDSALPAARFPIIHHTRTGEAVSGR